MVLNITGSGSFLDTAYSAIHDEVDDRGAVAVVCVA